MEPVSGALHSLQWHLIGGGGHSILVTMGSEKDLQSWVWPFLFWVFFPGLQMGHQGLGWVGPLMHVADCRVF